MLPNEAMYPYTAKEARDRGELEVWRANFRTNCACAGAIELAIHRDFDGMYLKDGCAKSVIDQYGYRRVGYVLANTLQMQSYDGRYHETNKKWSRTIFVPEDGGHRHTFLIGSHPAVLDGFASDYRAELAGCSCSARSIANPIPVNRISPVACWCCHRTRCGNPAGSRRTSCGWPSAASAAAPMPVADRCFAPVWVTEKRQGGTALSLWASSAMSVSLIGRQRSWPSCGRTRTRPPWVK